ncbi:MAG: TIGR02391 family protein [Roseburia sp.]|nr:TIGR02391 family protein [Roseburia sp.]
MQDTPLQRLCNWVNKITSQPNFLQVPFYRNDIKSVENTIINLSSEVSKSDPYHSKKLFKIKDMLFVGMFLEPIALGRLIEVLEYLWTNSNVNDMWKMMHHKIEKASKQLYLDGHYSNAAEDAFIEINARVKKLYARLEPNKPIPDGRDLMNKVFADGEKAMIEVCDRTNETGKNIHDGTRFLLAGAMAALRNPKAHSNDVVICQNECIRRLMFASMLMFKIDEAVTYSNLTDLDDE